MKASLEERIKAQSNADRLKSAKSLLKTGKLSGAWRDADGRHLHGVFRDAGNSFEVSVLPGSKFESHCSCGTAEPPEICEHAAALILHSARFGAAAARVDGGEPPSYCSALRTESLASLAAHASKPGAELFIDAAANFPHLPSKWENATLTVKMRTTAGREYIGNLNNVRQLSFEKSLAISLKLEDFSLHDRQILRFLAVNGEASNSQITLNSELTCELFHSLIDFPRFSRAGRLLHVRGDRAGAVLLVNRRGRGVKLFPGLEIDGALLPAVGAKVIAGRSGCWIGVESEYFFVPGTCEVAFLRNFFRASVQPPPGDDFEAFLAAFPLPSRRADSASVTMRTPRLLLNGGLCDGRLELRPEFLYEADGVVASFLPRSGGMARTRGKFFLRDESGEKRLLNELKFFGFTGEGGRLTLEGDESIGLFLDRALADIAAGFGVVLGDGLTPLQSAGRLPVLQFHCRVADHRPGCWKIAYTLGFGGSRAAWKRLTAAAGAGNRFVRLDSGGLAVISPEMRNFFSAAPGLVAKIDDLAHTFELPETMGEYFNFLVRELPGAALPELAPGNAAAQPAAPPDFSFAGELRGYQREGVEYLARMTDQGRNVILADEMGLGKTIQALALLAMRKHRNDPPALVICPASLIQNWARETAQFVPQMRVAAPGEGRERNEMLKHVGDYDLMILSYTAARMAGEKLHADEFSYLILDEAQHIKNPGSSNARHCKGIRARHRIVLSGTPLENSPEDLWSIFEFLDPAILGGAAGFRAYYHDIADNKAKQQDLAFRVGPFIKRRTKQQVATDLPPKFEKTIYCEMSAPQRKLYNSTLELCRARLREHRPGDAAGNAELFTTLLRLRQICCHPALLPDGAGKGVPSAKTELFLELLHEHLDSHHKMLLFSQFTSLLALLVPELDAAGIPFEYLDGSTRNRQSRIDRFNRTPELPLFLLSLKAGGTGLNLTAADTVIIYDPWWNPAVELQAADRTHRIGQTRPVNSLKLVVRDSIEERILSLQSRKRKIFDSVVDSPDLASATLSLDELRFLLEN